MFNREERGGQSSERVAGCRQAGSTASEPMSSLVAGDWRQAMEAENVEGGLQCLTELGAICYLL